MKQFDHIGSTELVSLPDAGIFDVPAKIDTGADSSAIWASAIKEGNGSLSFVLFDKTSPFYTGQVMTTRDYSVGSIKNSFGHSEFRYKVRIKAKLSGRVVWVRFSLANRASNRYPVLIGRRTLQGKFLVDVSKTLQKNAYRVLLLSVNRTPALLAYVDGLESAGTKLDITTATYEDLNFELGDSAVKVTLDATGQDIAGFDMVYFKTTARHLDIAAAVARYLTTRGAQYMDQAVSHFPASSKLYQYVILSDNGVAIPKSYFIAGKRLGVSYERFKEVLGLPFVLKDIHGKKGENNFLIKDKATFQDAHKLAVKQNLFLIGQAFISNDGDYRILVLGGRLGLVIHRKSTSRNHLNNTSAGAKATLVPLQNLPLKVHKISISSAKLMERAIAGVDMVQDNKTGSWYCFEVNDGPQLATGVFLKEKQAAVAAFLEEKVKR